MSIDGARDLNVFFSSPRVGFGEPPPASSATSLLTFADVVLALDRQNISDSFEFRSFDADFNAESDHTYASSGCSRTTRSQTIKAAAAHLTNRLPVEDEKLKPKTKDEDVKHVVPTSSNNIAPQTLSSKCMLLPSETDSQHLKGKRCSSVENISNSETELKVNVCKVCEWPEDLPKNSPRKSSSFEEVSCDSSKSSLKSSKSSEHVQRTGISAYTLHRFVNNTLEFPCWPRKADHTYATATWDGTAASHSLFEQELRQDSSRQNIIEDQEMEDTESYYSGQNQCEQLSETSVHLHNFAGFPQKDDHTYVKSTFSHFNSPGNIDADAFNIETDTDTLRTQPFSSATFPRQKMREDHTYFHSGLSRKSSGGAVGREWASTHTVANSSPPQDLKIEEAYRNLNSFSQSASTKKDHNYSTSA